MFNEISKLVKSQKSSCDFVECHCCHNERLSFHQLSQRLITRPYISLASLYFHISLERIPQGQRPPPSHQPPITKQQTYSCWRFNYWLHVDDPSVLTADNVRSQGKTGRPEHAANDSSNRAKDASDTL